MLRECFVVIMIVLFCSSIGVSQELPDSADLPRMPDEYRKGDYKDMSKRNPYGMSIYDAAEQEAEDNYFGTEVVPLEESKRILQQRQEAEEAEKNKAAATEETASQPDAQ